MTSAPSQASEEAIQEFLDTWTAPEGLEEDLRALLDRVSRQALERAAAKLQATADDLHAWMLKFDIYTPERKEKSLRAGELYAAAAAVRALKPEGR